MNINGRYVVLGCSCARNLSENFYAVMRLFTQVRLSVLIFIGAKKFAQPNANRIFAMRAMTGVKIAFCGFCVLPTTI